MILANAANGQQGTLLIPKLLAAGQQIRACVQSEGSAAILRDAGVTDVVVGNIDDPDLITRAVQGVEKIYHVCPGIQPRERQIGLMWIDAARREGVCHFVFSSVLHAILTDLAQHEIKRDIEEYLLSSGLEFTILQPTIYMAPRRFSAVIEKSILRAGWSLDRAQSLVDIGDVTDVACKVLLEDNAHAAATYELAGGERLTARSMAAIIGEVTGRPVQVEQIDADTYLTGLFGKRDWGTLPHEASVGRSLSARYSSHDFLGNPKVLSWLLGREPTTFGQFVTAQFAAFTARTKQA